MFALDPPSDYLTLVAPLPDGVRLASRLTADTAVVHVFSTRRAQLAKKLESLRSRIRQDAAVWVSWPKRASGVDTDITEDTIRDVALPMGFVDIKVCAVDETWSGLKLVIRKALRTSQ